MKNGAPDHLFVIHLLCVVFCQQMRMFRTNFCLVIFDFVDGEQTNSVFGAYRVQESKIQNNYYLT